VEAFVGTTAIKRRVRKKLMLDRSSILHRVPPAELEPKHVGEAADRGDKAAQEVLRETGEFLGIGLANAANLLNIETAVIGGGVANAGEWILRSARERLVREALKVPGETVRVVGAALGNRAGLAGAARLAMDFFNTAP
jgi:glucokinase